MDQFRKILRSSLETKQSRNPKYSLRSFAKDIGVSHSYLLDVLSGRRNLSEASAFKICSQLEISDRERALFLESAIGSRLAASMVEQDAIEDSGGRGLFTSWINIAILVLSGLPGVHLNAKVAALLLNQSEESCQRSIDALVSGGFVERNLNGNVVRTKAEDKTVSSSLPENQADLDRYSLELLSVIKTSIETVPFDSRSFGSNILSMKRSQFDKLEQRLFALLHEMMNEANRASTIEEHDSVYLLSAQLIPLAQI